MIKLTSINTNNRLAQIGWLKQIDWFRIKVSSTTDFAIGEYGMSTKHMFSNKFQQNFIGSSKQIKLNVYLFIPTNIGYSW